MAEELSFRSLPFVPAEGQVIYVEQSYNEKFNKFIRNNYDWLRSTFRSQGLEFCFLPLLAEEAIGYNAPYLNDVEKNIRVNQIPSIASCLVGDSLERPSLVFGLDVLVKDDSGNSVLQVVPIETKWYVSTKSTFANLAKDVKEQSRLQSRMYHNIEVKRKAEEEKRKREAEERAEHGCEIPDDVGSETDSNPCLRVRYSLKVHRDGDIRFRISEAPGLSSTDEVKFSLKQRPDVRSSINDSIEERNICSRKRNEEADNNFDSQSQLLIDEIRQRINALRNRGVNTMFLHDLIDEGEHLSGLRITKDYRIFLVDYNNLEIKLPVLPKAVFFLFLRHPEGIRFKELSDYYSELLQIYLKMNPNGGRKKQEQSIRDITDSCKNSINEKCARIREAFVSNFDDRLAKNYYVTGKRGEAKRIMLDESMIIWEK